MVTIVKSIFITDPVLAVTNDCGKGTVLDAVFTEVKRAVCRVHAP